MAALFALTLGRTLVQWAARLGIVGAISGLVYLAWFELAKRHPEFSLGGGGEGVVIAVLAAALIFVADPIANSVGLILVPDYGYYQSLALVGQDSASFDNATGEIAFLFIVLALITVIALLFLIQRRKK
jgi:hypothetical protein